METEPYNLGAYYFHVQLLWAFW